MFIWQICETRELLRRWLCHVAELINQRDKLIELIKIDESEWKKQLQKAEEVKVSICSVCLSVCLQWNTSPCEN